MELCTSRGVNSQISCLFLVARYSQLVSRLLQEVKLVPTSTFSMITPTVVRWVVVSVLLESLHLNRLINVSHGIKRDSESVMMTLKDLEFLSSSVNLVPALRLNLV